LFGVLFHTASLRFDLNDLVILLFDQCRHLISSTWRMSVVKMQNKVKEGADIIHELSELIYRALDLFDALVTFLYFSEGSSSIAVSCRVKKLEASRK
jgi:hypothetical protein